MSPGTITLLRAAQATGIGQDRILLDMRHVWHSSSIPMNELMLKSPIQSVRSQQVHRRADIEGLGPLPGFSVLYLALFNAGGAILKEELANASRDSRHTIASRPPWAAGHIFKFSARLRHARRILRARLRSRSRSRRCAHPRGSSIS